MLIVKNLKLRILYAVRLSFTIKRHFKNSSVKQNFKVFTQYQIHPKRNDKGSSLNGKENTMMRNKNLHEGKYPTSKGKYMVKAVRQPQ